MYRVPLAFDPEAIAAVLTDMSPEGFLTIFSSKTNQGKTDQVRPTRFWAYMTRFRLFALSQFLGPSHMLHEIGLHTYTDSPPCLL